MRARIVAALAFTVAATAACGDATSLPTDLAPQFGKGNGGGGGGGTTDPTATFLLPANGFGLTGDGLYSNAYAEKVCGVHAKIFATTAASNSGDAIMHTSNPKYADRRCRSYPRTVRIDYGGSVQQEEVFINVGGIHNTGYYIPLGHTRQHRLGINPERSAVCDGALVFDTTWQGTPIEARPVHVTRIAGDRWLVQTDDPATPEVEPGRAFCTSTGASHTISVELTVVSSHALSPQ